MVSICGRWNAFFLFSERVKGGGQTQIILTNRDKNKIFTAFSAGETSNWSKKKLDSLAGYIFDADSILKKQKITRTSILVLTLSIEK